MGALCDDRVIIANSWIICDDRNGALGAGTAHVAAQVAVPKCQHGTGIIMMFIK